MTKTIPQIKIVNCTTGEEIVRDATEQEIAQMQQDANNDKAIMKEVQAKAITRQAVLDRLGVTAEEATLLLG